MLQKARRVLVEYGHPPDPIRAPQSLIGPPRDFMRVEVPIVDLAIVEQGREQERIRVRLEFVPWTFICDRSAPQYDAAKQSLQEGSTIRVLTPPNDDALTGEARIWQRQKDGIIVVSYTETAAPYATNP